jgi:hypothetical protein
MENSEIKFSIEKEIENKTSSQIFSADKNTIKYLKDNVSNLELEKNVII